MVVRRGAWIERKENDHTRQERNIKLRKMIIYGRRGGMGVNKGNQW